MTEKFKKKFYLKGLTPLGYSFYFLLLSALILDIFNHLVAGIWSIGLWIIILVLETIGILRKSNERGDTLSEALWFSTEGYRTRKNMIAWLAIGIAGKIASFGFIYKHDQWAGINTLLTEAPWQGYFILSKVFLISVAVGVAVWLYDHFKLLGRDG